MHATLPYYAFSGYQMNVSLCLLSTHMHSHRWPSLVFLPTHALFAFSFIGQDGDGFEADGNVGSEGDDRWGEGFSEEQAAQDRGDAAPADLTARISALQAELQGGRQQLQQLQKLQQGEELAPSL